MEEEYEYTVGNVRARVTAAEDVGRRPYMEDCHVIGFERDPAEPSNSVVFFGVFDGHGGPQAALNAKENLVRQVVGRPQFWEENEESVKIAIREGFLATHYEMQKEAETWPRRQSGDPSTAGTTATVGFLRSNGKLYIGHVGDSRAVIGKILNGDRKSQWAGEDITSRHSATSPAERKRVEADGGKVLISHVGDPRVVWERPEVNYPGPIRRSAELVSYPFLCVTRSLGDFWSFCKKTNKFAVSPEPEVLSLKINPNSTACLLFLTDGVDILTCQDVVNSVYVVETDPDIDENVSRRITERALSRLGGKRVDNMTVVTVVLEKVMSVCLPKPTSNHGRKKKVAQRKSYVSINHVNGHECKEAEPMALALASEQKENSNDSPTCSEAEQVPKALKRKLRPVAPSQYPQLEPALEKKKRRKPRSSASALELSLPLEPLPKSRKRRSSAPEQTLPAEEPVPKARKPRSSASAPVQSLPSESELLPKSRMPRTSVSGSLLPVKPVPKARKSRSSASTAEKFMPAKPVPKARKPRSSASAAVPSLPLSLPMPRSSASAAVPSLPLSLPLPRSSASAPVLSLPLSLPIPKSRMPCSSTPEQSLTPVPKARKTRSAAPVAEVSLPANPVPRARTLRSSIPAPEQCLPAGLVPKAQKRKPKALPRPQTSEAKLAPKAQQRKSRSTAPSQAKPTRKTTKQKPRSSFPPPIELDAINDVPPLRRSTRRNKSC